MHASQLKLCFNDVSVPKSLLAARLVARHRC
jgi:hypothetical protein